MSLASLGNVGSLASIPASQRTQETDKTQRQTTEQNRAAQAVERAADAAGIAQTEEDSAASDRDADGRRPWEIPAAASGKQETAPSSLAALPLSKDPTHSRGNLLDLTG